MFLNHISITSLIWFVVFVCFSLKERSAQPFLTTGTMGSTIMGRSGNGSAEGLWITDHLVTAELRGLVRCIRRALGVFARAVPCCTAHAG